MAVRGIQVYDLKKQELGIIIFLVASLTVGLGIHAYKKSHHNISFEARPFDADDMKGEYQSNKTGKGGSVNINEAGAGELMKLKGIGKALAGRIVEYRSSNGRFASASEIKNVKGIGEKLFEQIKDDITAE